MITKLSKLYENEERKNRIVAIKLLKMEGKKKFYDNQITKCCLKWTTK